ncbi:hypothetical protein N9Z14_07815 [Opitutales bacterium]|nr:hypothetical protein [Opitutales bacterium]
MIKTPLKFIALLSGAVLFASSGFAQTVATDPVGYVTLTVNGSPDGVQTAYTPLSLSLEKVVLASGALSEVPTSAVATDSSASYTPGEFAGTDASGNATHYLQFSSDGLIVDIIANDATTITAGTDLTGLATSGDAYVVKEHSTIADVFGAANEAGLTAGANSTASDLLYIMSSDGAGVFATYFVQDDPTSPADVLGGDGWRKVGAVNSLDQSDVVIGPDDGIILARGVTGDIDIVVSGSVNVIDHQRDLPAGFSMVSYPYPVDVTLDDSNIYTASNGYVSGANSSASDLVYVLGSDGLYATYFHQDDPTSPADVLGGDGWRQVGQPNNADKGSVVIPAGSSIIIQHTGAGLAWADVKPF